MGRLFWIMLLGPVYISIFTVREGQSQKTHSNKSRSWCGGAKSQGMWGSAQEAGKGKILS